MSSSNIFFKVSTYLFAHSPIFLMKPRIFNTSIDSSPRNTFFKFTTAFLTNNRENYCVIENI